MKTVNKVAFQGDVSVVRVDLIPDFPGIDESREITRTNGVIIVTHSESGHHHYVEAAGARFYGTADPNICYLRVDGEYVDLLHNKPGPDGHETQRIPAGTYQINRQLEKRPSGWERVAD